MNTITLQLPQETTEKLRERACRQGKSLEGYLQELAQQHVLGPRDETITAGDGALPLAEMDRLFDELCKDLPKLPQLPADFSRADIYAEHD